MIARGLRGPGGYDPLLLIGLALLVFYFFQGGLVGPIQRAERDPIAFVGFLVAIVLGISVHEFMHAYAAHRLGDDTGRLMGRMTLNPLAHFDFFGSFLLVIAGFGYGKPVPINEGRLRSSGAIALVALAGPLTNFALAAICAIPLRFADLRAVGVDVYAQILASIVVWNCVLGIFNLLPVPPLDGSNVVYGLLPPRQQYSWQSVRQYGPFILLGLFIFGLPILNQVVFGPALQLASFLTGQRFR